MSVEAVPSEAPPSPLEKLRSLNRGRVVLRPREIPVGLALLPMAEAMDTKVLPGAVVNRVLEHQAAGKAFTEEELNQIAEDVSEHGGIAHLRAFVARSIESLYDEPVKLTAEDTLQFTDEEFSALLRYCTREDPLPGPLE